MYDVIVVGSGPAGSTSAALLAKQGLNVLLLDRESFPRDKPCGDLIGPHAFRVLERMGVEGHLRESSFYPMDAMQLYAPNRRSVSVDYRKYQQHGGFGVIRRTEFDHMLHRFALECGVQFQQAQVQHLVREGQRAAGVQVELDGQPVQLLARAVIGADGATSLIARELRGGQLPNQHRAVALRGYIEASETAGRTGAVYFQKDLLPGYAWAFPVNEQWFNVGVGMRSDHYKRQDQKLDRMLEQFINHPEQKAQWKADTLGNIKAWSLSLGSSPGSRVFDGAVLAGDAGGFVDPLVGAGIHTAMWTGALAAEVVGKAVQAGDVSRQRLAEYDRRWQAELQRGFWLETGLQKIFTGAPWLINLLPSFSAPSRPLVRYVVERL